MKAKLFLIICLSASITISGCKNKNIGENGELSPDLVNNPSSASGENGELPKFTFEKDVHDFGMIKQGEKISYSFKFKNTGKADLIISSAKGSCGCTVPQYPKMPIAPGGEGVIDVTFDSSGKSGKQNKQITVVANTIPNTTVLTITGLVETEQK